MKKILLVMLSWCLFIAFGFATPALSTSADGTTATLSNSTAGCMVGYTYISKKQKQSISTFTVASGNIDARDFKVMKDSMPNLKFITLTGASVVAYTGTQGTNGTGSQTYAANMIPVSAFKQKMISTIALPSGTTRIGAYAFYACSVISVDMPSGVQYIDNNCFDQCSGLVLSSLPASLKEIGSYALASCAKLTISNFPSSLAKISDGAFIYCYGLTNLTLPASLTTLGISSFEYCTGLTTVAMSACTALPVIGDRAFWQCTKLANVTLPTSGLTNIKNSAFRATLISSIDLPLSLTTIGAEAFTLCPNLTSLTIPASVNNYNPTAVNYSPKVVVHFAPGNLTYPTVTITDSNGDPMADVVLSADGKQLYAMVENTYSGELFDISETKFYNQITEIKANAFINCAVSTINLGKNVTTLAPNAFYKCAAVINADAANPNLYITNGMFFNKTNTKLLSGERASGAIDLSLYTGLTEIAANAFQYNTAITSVTLPSGITKLGDWAFHQSSITTINLPNSINYIGAYCFGNCTLSGSITMPDALQVVNDGAFQSNKISSVSFSSSSLCKTINTSAYQNCTSLTTVTLPVGITAVGYRAFRDCSNLTTVTNLHLCNRIKSLTEVFMNTKLTGEITLPDSITGLSASFYGCYNITKVNLNAQLKTIDNYSFNGCVNLSSCDIPAGVTFIGNNSFMNCSKMVFNVAPANANYCSLNGSLYSKDKTRFMAVSGNETDFKMPASVSEIVYYAFSSRPKLLTVTLSNSVTSLPASCFYGSTNLKKVVLPTGLSTISDGAFYGCTKLDSLYMPASVSYIGTTALYNTTSLKHLFSLSDAPATCITNTFNGINSAVTLHVPYGRKSTYAATATWSSFNVAPKSIVEDLKSATVIALLEGLWNGTTEGMNTCKQFDEVSGDFKDAFGASVADTLTVELHNSDYTLAYQLHGLNISTDGVITTAGKPYLELPMAATGNYYITIKHRNHLETTSASALSFAGNVYHNFTDAATKAYVFSGASFTPTKLVNGRWMLYVGNVMADEYPEINFVDVQQLFDNSSDNTGKFGYQVLDMNGDGFVDSFDTQMSFDNQGVMFYFE